MTMISEAFNYNAMASDKVFLLCCSTYPFTVSVHLKKKNQARARTLQQRERCFFFSFRVNAFWSRFWDFKTFKYRINDADLQHWHSGQCSMDDLTQIIAFRLPYTNILIAYRAQIHLAAVSSHLVGLAYETTFFF